MTRTLATVLLSAALGADARAQGPAPTEQLREIEERRGKVEFHVRRLEDKASAVLAIVEELEQVARAAEKDAAEARRKASTAGARVAAAVEVESGLEAKRVKIANDLGPRLLLRYRLRGGSFERAMLAAPSIGDLLWRRRMVDRILRDDLGFAERIEEAHRAAQNARLDVERERTGLATAEAAAKARADEARQKRAVQADVLQRITKEKGRYDRAVAELERSRTNLLDALAKMPPTPEGLGGFGARRGQLAQPTAGKVEVAFGRQVDRHFKTVVQQKGIDIRAPAGAQVVAPHPAQVGFAGWFRGFGNLVVLDHGEGYYTLYAHLDEIRVAAKDRVEQGTVLGTVGDTGSLKGAYLYFEIRSGAKALDPKEWLAKG